jgi:hypothetical protein
MSPRGAERAKTAAAANQRRRFRFGPISEREGFSAKKAGQWDRALSPRGLHVDCPRKIESRATLPFFLCIVLSFVVPALISIFSFLPFNASLFSFVIGADFPFHLFAIFF